MSGCGEQETSSKPGREVRSLIGTRPGRRVIVPRPLWVRLTRFSGRSWHRVANGELSTEFSPLHRRDIRLGDPSPLRKLDPAAALR